MPVQPFTFNKRQGPGTGNASIGAGSSIASDAENGSIVSGGPSQQTMGERALLNSSPDSQTHTAYSPRADGW